MSYKLHLLTNRLASYNIMTKFKLYISRYILTNQHMHYYGTAMILILRIHASILCTNIFEPATLYRHACMHDDAWPCSYTIYSFVWANQREKQ